MRLAWRPSALSDRENILNRISENNPDAAIALDDTFELKAEHARQRPSLYRKGRIPGTREIVATPNYVMVYLIKDEMVEILRVMHARQKWP